jgi:hypothetical protein
MDTETPLQKLKRLCDRLYDPQTPEEERSELSMEISALRAEISGQRDPLEAMMRASGPDEEGDP